MKKRGNRLAGVLLCVALAFGLLPGMRLTALAWEGNPYAALVNSTTTVEFFHEDWYIIADNSTAVDAGYVTLFAKDPIGRSAFNNVQSDGNAYSGSAVQQYLNNLTRPKGSFARAADAIAPTDLTDVGVTGAKLYLLSLDEARALKVQNPNILDCTPAGGASYDDWWLRTSGDVVVSDNGTVYFAAAVHCTDGQIFDGGVQVDCSESVRPALKLDLSSVIFSSDSKKFLLPQTVSASDVTAAYGDTDKRVSATADGNGAISYAVKAGSEDYIDVDASTGALTIKKVPEDGEAYVTATAAQTNIYAQASRDVTVTISRADLVITAKDQEYEYDGDPHGEGDPAYEDPAEIAGKVAVSDPGLKNEDKIASLTLTGARTKVGVYENEIEISGIGITDAAGHNAKDNYNIFLVHGNLTITKAEVTVTGLTAADRAYEPGNLEVTLSGGTVAGAAEGDKVAADLTGAKGSLADADAGENKPVTVTGVTLSGDDAGNYLLSAQPADVTVNISRIADPAVIAETAAVTAGGNTVDLAGNVTGAVGGVSYAMDGDANGCTLDGSILVSGDTAGACRVRVTVADSTNYSGKTGTITVTVAEKASADLTVTQADSVYGTELAEPVWTRPANPVKEAVVRYSGTTAAGTAYGPAAAKPAEAGGYTVTVTEETNDTIYTGSADFVIGKAEPAVTAPAAKTDLVETGAPQELVEAGTVTGGEMQYALGTDESTAPASGWSAAVPVGTEAGTWYVWYKVVGDANHNDTDPACVTVTIAAPEPEPPEPPRPEPSGKMRPVLKSEGKKALQLSFTQMSNVDGYDVYLAPDSSKHFKLKKTLSAGETSCTLSGLKMGTAYKVYVEAWITENGDQKAVSKSETVYSYTSGGNGAETNLKSIKAKKSVTVTVDGAQKLSPKAVGEVRGQKVAESFGGFRYESSNPDVAKVDGKGKVTGVAAGSCTVTITGFNGVSKNVKITVKAKAESLSFPEKSYKVKVGKTLKLGKKLVVTPSDAYVKLTWKSSKTSVATVDKNGVVTGVSKGTTTITVKTSTGLKVKVKVKVK